MPLMTRANPWLATKNASDIECGRSGTDSNADSNKSAASADAAVCQCLIGFCHE
jgi:hypothetical protein